MCCEIKQAAETISDEMLFGEPGNTAQTAVDDFCPHIKHACPAWVDMECKLEGGCIYLSGSGGDDD